MGTPKRMHGLTEKFLTAPQHEKNLVLEKINKTLLEIDGLKSVRASLDLDKSYMRHFADFRRRLREILARYGVQSNPGWTDEDILEAINQLPDKARESAQI